MAVPPAIPQPIRGPTVKRGVMRGDGGWPTGGQPATYWYAASGRTDDAQLNQLLAYIVGLGTPANVCIAGQCNIATGLTIENATAPITVSGPGALRLVNDVAAGTAIVNVINSPNVSFANGLVIDENGANQTAHPVYGIYYDVNSSGVSANGCRFENIKCFGFMSNGGSPTERTANVSFTNNIVECSANEDDDVVILVADVGTATGNIVTGVGSGAGILLYESDQCVAAGNVVVLTGQVGEGIEVSSSTGCVVSGNSVWGGDNDACYQVDVETDNDNARTQTDCVFSGNHAGEYVGAAGQPAAYNVVNASGTVITGGTVVDCWVVVSTNGTCGSLDVANIQTVGGPEIWYQGGTTTPNPTFNNVGTNYVYGAVLAYAENAPSSATTYTLVNITTGVTALDTTHLAVTFVGPPSGLVKVRLQGMVKGGATAGTDKVVFAVVSSTGSPGTLAGVVGLVYVSPVSTAADNEEICTMDQYITVTAGTSYTWYFAAAYVGAAASVIAQGGTTNTTSPTGAPAFIEVLAA